MMNKDKLSAISDCVACSWSSICLNAAKWGEIRDEKEDAPRARSNHRLLTVVQIHGECWGNRRKRHDPEVEKLGRMHWGHEARDNVGLGPFGM